MKITIEKKVNRNRTLHHASHANFWWSVKVESPLSTSFEKIEAAVKNALIDEGIWREDKKGVASVLSGGAFSEGVYLFIHEYRDNSRRFVNERMIK